MGGGAFQMFITLLDIHVSFVILTSIYYNIGRFTDLKSLKMHHIGGYNECDFTQ